MSELHFPWLEASVLIALIGSLWVWFVRDPFVACRHSLFFNSLVLATSIGAWVDYEFVSPLGRPPTDAHDFWNPLTKLLGSEIFVIDPLSSPLLCLVALLYFLVTLTTLRTKIPRFSFASTLASEAIVLATFSCEDPILIIPLLIAATVPPYWELKARGHNTGIYVKHMALYIVMLAIGWLFIEWDAGKKQGFSSLAILPLLIAMLIRSGIAPFHCWYTDLFEKATFGTSLLVAMPLVGAYATIRLLLPIAPDWIMKTIGLFSLVTVVYAAGIALVQTDARRFFCYLFLSYSAFVFAGLEAVTPISLTGALCAWMAVSISLGGFGLTLRALEARRGRLRLDRFKGLYNHAPSLAVLFMLTGLASVGFPGTFGFIGSEMLVDGAVKAFPYVGVAVVFASALNGISVVKAYFRLFTGTQHRSMVSLGIVPRERFAVITLAALILIGGLMPQYNVASRFRAAQRVLRSRGITLHQTAEEHDSIEVGSK